MFTATDGDQLLYAFRSPHLLFRGATLGYQPQSLGHLWFTRLPRLVPPNGLVVHQPVADRTPAPHATLARVRYAEHYQVEGIELLGVARVRITGGSAVSDVPAVTVAPVRETASRDPLQAARAARDIALPWLAARSDHEWAMTAVMGTEDPSAIADVLCQALFSDWPERADLLGTTDLPARLDACRHALGQLSGGLSATRAGQSPVAPAPSSVPRPPAAPPPFSTVGPRPLSFSVRRAPRPEPSPPATFEPTRSAPPSPNPEVVVPVRAPDGLRTFADVGGMEKLKRELRRSIGILVRQPDAVEALDYHFSGVLLHGPPGVGKTFLAEATAGEFGLNFASVVVGDVLSCWHGEVERNLRAAFATARRHAPCLLFFDEFDALAAKRGGGGSNETFDRRILDQLLSLLEDTDANRGVVVLAATNDLRALDPAAIREGRFDRQVFIDVPDRGARRAIFATHLEQRPLAGEIDLDDLADRSVGLTAAAVRAIVVAAAGFAIEAYEVGEIPSARISAVMLERALLERRGQDRPLVERRTWADLVLGDETMSELKRLVHMMVNPDELRRRGLRPVSGALLTGPPGTGKSTIARVIASETEGAVNFYPIRASDILASALGAGPARIRDLFERARQYAPSLIFVDEVDSLLHRRGGEDSAGHERDAVIGEFLGQLDGLSSYPGVFVLAATNLPEQLDPALTRSGRLTRRIDVPLPDIADRCALFRLFLRPMSVAGDVEIEELAAATQGCSGADIEAICAEAGYQSMERDVEGLTVCRSDLLRALARYGVGGSSASS